jgi:hypothetical protein
MSSMGKFSFNGLRQARLPLAWLARLGRDTLLHADAEEKGDYCRTREEGLQESRKDLACGNRTTELRC